MRKKQVCLAKMLSLANLCNKNESMSLYLVRKKDGGRWSIIKEAVSVQELVGISRYKLAKWDRKSVLETENHQVWWVKDVRIKSRRGGDNGGLNKFV